METKTDELSRKIEQTNEAGYVTTWLYENDGRKITQTNPDGSTIITESYLDGQLKSITGTGVVAKYYDYGVNADGTTFTTMNMASATSPRYKQTITDALDRVSALIMPGFAGTLNVQSFTYNDLGLLVKESQTERADTLHEYDALANPIRSGRDMNGNGSLDLASSDRVTDFDTVQEYINGDWFAVTTNVVYAADSNSTPTTVSIQRKRLTGFDTTAAGILVTETISEDIHGNLTVSSSRVDRLAKQLSQQSDLPTSDLDAVSLIINGYQQSQSSPTHGGSTTFGYDGLGRVVTTTDPRTGTSTTTYDSVTGQITSLSDADNNITTITYYAQGELGAEQEKSIQDALNQFRYLAYNQRGELTRSWGQTTYPTEQTYNVYGEMVSLKTYREGTDWDQSIWPASPGTADETLWNFDEATGLLVRKEYADTNGTDYIWTASGLLASRSWARASNSLTTTYSYDARTAELLTTDYSDSTHDIMYRYDRLGRLASVEDAEGIRSFTYNAQLQLESETLPSGHVLARGYEDTTGSTPGRNAGYILQNAASSVLAVADYAYETTGRLSTISDTTDTFTYSYLNHSNLIASLASSAASRETLYAYEPNRDLLTAVDNRVGTSTVSKYGYTNDDLGRRIHRTQEGIAFASTTTVTFSYNDRSEVVSSVNDQITSRNFGYVFDNIGNRTSSIDDTITTTYTANELNQYIEINGVLFGYDEDGNLLADKDRKYFYNGENRLISSEPLVPALGDKRVDFLYDYQGRRIQKTVSTFNGSTWDLHTDQGFIYDGWNLIATVDKANEDTLIKSYTWGLDLSATIHGAGGVGGLLSSRDLIAGSGSHFFFYDANGNVSDLIDNTGAITAHYEYSPFGQIKLQTGSYASENAFRFSTKYKDDETRLLYYGFRYYDSVAGMWMSRDPIGEDGGFNLYGLVGNEVISAIDLLGLDYFNSASLEGGLYFPWGGRYSLEGSITLKDCCDKNGKEISNGYALATGTLTLAAGIGYNFTYGIKYKKLNFNIEIGFNLDLVSFSRTATLESPECGVLPKCVTIFSKMTVGLDHSYSLQVWKLGGSASIYINGGIYSEYKLCLDSLTATAGFVGNANVNVVIENPFGKKALVDETKGVEDAKNPFFT
ncbi:MAG: RHS repeat-associated core domain-containing protein, partial [Bacteroidota bacterium]